MKQFQLVLLGAMCAAAPALAQTTERRTETQTRAETTTTSEVPRSTKWKGMLVDANCQVAGTVSQSMQPSSTSVSQSAREQTTTRSEQEADRSTTVSETEKSTSRSSTDPSAGTSQSARTEEKTRTERSTTEQRVDPETGAPAQSATTSQSARHERRHEERSSSAATSRSTDNPNWDRWMSCTPTASSTAFGLVTQDGRFLRFDSVGNIRAQEAFRNNKRFANTSGKSLHVKVAGYVQGDKVFVDSIR